MNTETTLKNLNCLFLKEYFNHQSFCVVLFLDGFQIDGINASLATIQTLKIQACSGHFLNMHTKIYRVFQQPAAFLFYIEKIIGKKKVRNNTKSGQCLEISCATIFSAKDPLTVDLMHFAYYMNRISGDL